jgi:hypothetical protein
VPAQQRITVVALVVFSEVEFGLRRAVATRLQRLILAKECRRKTTVAELVYFCIASMPLQRLMSRHRSPHARNFQPLNCGSPAGA